MTVTYSLSKNELNEDFLNAIKSTFKSDRISIIVEEESEEPPSNYFNLKFIKEIQKRSEDLKNSSNKVFFENDEFSQNFS